MFSTETSQAHIGKLGRLTNLEHKWIGLSDRLYRERFQSTLRCFPFKG